MHTFYIRGVLRATPNFSTFKSISAGLITLGLLLLVVGIVEFIEVIISIFSDNQDNLRDSNSTCLMKEKVVYCGNTKPSNEECPMEFWLEKRDKKFKVVDFLRE